MTMYAVTNANDLVNLCNDEDIYLDFILSENNKIQAVVQSLYDLPKYANLVSCFEKLWNKKRQDFNIFEIDYVNCAYKKYF